MLQKTNIPTTELVAELKLRKSEIEKTYWITKAKKESIENCIQAIRDSSVRDSEESIKILKRESIDYQEAIIRLYQETTLLNNI